MELDNSHYKALSSAGLDKILIIYKEGIAHLHNVEYYVSMVWEGITLLCPDCRGVNPIIGIWTGMC